MKFKWIEALDTSEGLARPALKAGAGISVHVAEQPQRRAAAQDQKREDPEEWK